MFYSGLHLMQTFFYIFNLSRAHNIREPIDLNNFSCIRLILGHWILATLITCCRHCHKPFSPLLPCRHMPTLPSKAATHHCCWSPPSFCALLCSLLTNRVKLSSMSASLPSGTSDSKMKNHAIWSKMPLYIIAPWWSLLCSNGTIVCQGVERLQPNLAE